MSAPQAISALEHLPLVRRVARQIGRRLPSHVEQEDLVSAGVVGLLEAVERFDPSQATPFSSFAEFRVRGAILDELRRRDSISRDARAESRRIEAAIQELEKELGHVPTEDDLAKKLSQTVEGLRKTLERAAPVRILNVDEIVNIAGFETSPFDAAARSETIAMVATAIETLSEKQQQALALYYQEELTLKQIAEVFGVTESRVSQILSEATVRIRAKLGIEPKKGRSK